MENIKVYVCEICGRKYIHNQRWKSKHTCSKACYQKRKYGLEKDKPRSTRLKEIDRIRKASTLEAENNKALAAGMTYGQYQALKYMKRRGLAL